MPKQTSIIDSLPPDAQEKIVGWLEMDPARVVVERIAEPPPIGFGLHTHVTTLRRFYTRHRAQTRPVDMDLAKLLAPSDAKDPFAGATQSLVTDWAFQIATSPRRNVGAFKALSRWILKMKEQEQRDREITLIAERLALEREKFQFNAARHALLHHAELGKVMQNPAADNEDKIDAARAQIFGGSASASSADREVGKSKLVPMSPLR